MLSDCRGREGEERKGKMMKCKGRYMRQKQDGEVERVIMAADEHLIHEYMREREYKAYIFERECVDMIHT